MRYSTINANCANPWWNWVVWVAEGGGQEGGGGGGGGGRSLPHQQVRAFWRLFGIQLWAMLSFPFELISNTRNEYLNIFVMSFIFIPNSYLLEFYISFIFYTAVKGWKNEKVMGLPTSLYTRKTIPKEHEAGPWGKITKCIFHPTYRLPGPEWNFKCPITLALNSLMTEAATAWGSKNYIQLEVWKRC